MKRFILKSGYKILPAFIALILVLFLCFSAVAQTPTPSPSPSPSPPSPVPSPTPPSPVPSPTPPSTPAILSVSLSVSPPASPPASPAPDTTYADVKISIQVVGLNLVDKIGQANAPGEGHVIYYLNDPATFPLLKAYTAQGTYFPETSTTFVRSNYNYTLGAYWVFAAQLVNNDDTPFDPPVFAKIATNLPSPGQAATQPAITSFSISAQTPATPVASPVPDTTYMDVKLYPQVSGFEVVPTGGTPPPNVAGQGHYMYYRYVDPLTVKYWDAYIDDYYSFNSASAPATFENAYAGYKFYSVELVTNNSYPLDPPVYAIFRGYLQPGLGTPPPSTATTPVPTTSPPPPTSSTGGIP